MLQSVVACCNVLQCVAACCSVLQCVAACCSVLQRVAVRCSVLQRVAVRCSVLQCVAVCCSVLQRVVCIKRAVCSYQSVILCMTVSADISTPPKSTKSRNSDSSVSRSAILN